MRTPMHCCHSDVIICAYWRGGGGGGLKSWNLCVCNKWMTPGEYLSPFEHRIRPILGPIRKCNNFSVFAVYVTHKFNTYFGTFCLWKGDKIKLNSPGYYWTDSPCLKRWRTRLCRLVHHRLSTACLFIGIVACPVLSLYYPRFTYIFFINKNVSWESYDLAESGGGVGSDDRRDVRIFDCDVQNLLYDVSATSTVLTVTFNLVCCWHTESTRGNPLKCVQKCSFKLHM